MEHEHKSLVLIGAIVVVVIATIATSVSYCSVNKTRAVVKMVEAGADPIAARCAVCGCGMCGVCGGAE